MKVLVLGAGIIGVSCTWRMLSPIATFLKSQSSPGPITAAMWVPLSQTT